MRDPRLRHFPTLLHIHLLAFASLVAAQPAEVDGAPMQDAQPQVSGSVLTWRASDARQLIVIDSPTGDQLREIFEPWQSPTLDLGELPSLPDGQYQYNVRLLPTEEGVKRSLAYGGTLKVSGGTLTGGRVEPVGRAASREAADQPLQHVAQPLTESGARPSLILDDTTTNGTGTDDDWWIYADVNGGEDFTIWWDSDHGSGTILPFHEVFTIERNINPHALYLDGRGATNTAEIGVNTNTPSSTLHLAEANVADIRFEDIGATPYEWDLEGSSSAFVLRDVTGVSTPFVVEAGASNYRLHVDTTGNVGLGTSSPQGNLHISGGASSDLFSGIGPDLHVGPAFNFGYSGSSFGVGSGFFNARPAAGAVAPNPALYFMTSNVDRLMIDRDGDIAVDMDDTFGNTFDPQHPIHAQQSGARLTSGGVWTNASSRALKENIVPLTVDAALAALHALEPVEYNYKVEPDDPQVGFIAEDVPDLVATPDRRALAPTDIVGVLTKVVQEQQRALVALQQEVARLQAKVAEP